MKLPYLLLALLMGLSAFECAAEDKPLYQKYFEQAVPDSETLKHSEDLLKEHKDISLQEKLVIQPFHKHAGELETAPFSLCRNCHSPLPHSKQLRSRAFLNMHTRFIACETCHFRPKDHQLTYQWLDLETMTATSGEGKFRTSHNLDNAKQRPSNPKITPLFQNQSAVVAKNSAFSSQILQQWEKANFDQKVELRAKIHIPLEKKGPKCQDCHNSEKTMLNLTALGATAEEKTAIEKHIIPQFFKDYEKDDQKIIIRNLLR